MNRPNLKSLATGRLRRPVLVLGVTGGLLLGAAGAAQAATAIGTEPGHVALNPASGSVTSSPTWSTDVACNPGFQGSAVFRAVKADGTTFSISGATNSVATPFSGTLQAPLSTIESLSNLPANGSQELVVICFSGPSLTGSSDPEMDTFISYDDTAGTYTTSSTQQVPVGEIGGIAFAGLAAVGLAVLQVRRRRTRRAQASAA